jgi:hypothetical protein
MAELTYAKCLDRCLILGDCCSQLYCHLAIENAEKDGVILKETNSRIPLLDDKNQCIAAPHHRGLCTLHMCEKFFWDDREFKEKYFSLRDQIIKIEEDLFMEGLYDFVKE